MALVPSFPRCEEHMHVTSVADVVMVSLDLTPKEARDLVAILRKVVSQELSSRVDRETANTFLHELKEHV